MMAMKGKKNMNNADKRRNIGKRQVFDFKSGPRIAADESNLVK